MALVTVLELVDIELVRSWTHREMHLARTRSAPIVMLPPNQSAGGSSAENVRASPSCPDASDRAWRTQNTATISLGRTSDSVTPQRRSAVSHFLTTALRSYAPGAMFRSSTIRLWHMVPRASQNGVASTGSTNCLAD